MDNKFKPHPKQLLLLEAKERFILGKAGVQGGKTTIGAMRLCADIYKDYLAGKKGDYLLAAPTAKIIQQSTLPKFKEIIPSDWYVWKESRQVFELIWGSRIFVRSTDNPDYLEGMTLLEAWLDEAGQTKADVWIHLQARLSINQGHLLMTTTPYGDHNWTNKVIYSNAGRVNDLYIPERDKDIAVFEWTSLDNPAFPKEEYERARKTLSPEIFDRRYRGIFTTLEGLVYTLAPEDVIDPIEIDPSWKKFGGMDFGKTNPTAILCFAEDPVSHVFYLYKEFYRSETSLKLMAKFIEEEDLKFVLADPQSAQLITELSRQYGLSGLQPAENDITLGLERITALIREHRLKVFKTCDNVLEEISAYHYGKPDEDGYVKDKPVAKDNHAMDALRYAFSKNLDVRKIYSPEKVGITRQRTKRYNGPRRSDLHEDIWTGYIS
jgi:PBSX family phage terminase large subunit